MSPSDPPVPAVAGLPDHLPSLRLKSRRPHAAAAAVSLGLLAFVTGPLLVGSMVALPLPWPLVLLLLPLALFAGGSLGVLAWHWAMEALALGPRLVLDDEGLQDRFLPAAVRWRELRAAFDLRQEGKPFLFLELADPEAFLARVPRWRRLLPPFTADPFMGRYLVVLLTGLDADPAALEAEIRARILLFGGGAPAALPASTKKSPESGAEEGQASRDEVDELGGTTF